MFSVLLLAQIQFVYPQIENVEVKTTHQCCRVRKLATGTEAQHFCAILDNGSLKCWGKNDVGQLGLIGTMVGRGGNNITMGDNLPEVHIRGGNVTEVFIGNRYTCSLTSDSMLGCWGGGFCHGCDWSGWTSAMVRAVGSGSDHICVIYQTGSVKCFGNNAFGKTGNVEGNTGPDYIDFGTGRTATHIAAGGSHSCAILDNKKLMCWGSNRYGQLGAGETGHGKYIACTLAGCSGMGDSLNAVNLGVGGQAIALALGDQHTCVLLNNNSVKCWGSNMDGQLGNTSDGIIDLGVGKSAVAISAAMYHTCALLDDASVKCWGASEKNTNGTTISMYQSIAINLGTNRTALAISTWGQNTCVLLDNGGLKCWGINNEGQLGIENTVNRGGANDTLGDSLPYVNMGTECSLGCEKGSLRNGTCSKTTRDYSCIKASSADKLTWSSIPVVVAILLAKMFHDIY